MVESKRFSKNLVCEEKVYSLESDLAFVLVTHLEIINLGFIRRYSKEQGRWREKKEIFQLNERFGS